MMDVFDIAYFTILIVLFLGFFIFIITRSRTTFQKYEHTIELSEMMAKRQVESLEVLKAILEESKKTNQLLTKTKK